MRNINWKAVILTVLSAGCICFIFGNSMQIADVSANRSSAVTEVVAKILAVFSVYVEQTALETIIRKVAHFSEYLLLATLICTAFLSANKRLWRNVLNVLFIVLMTAVLDENIQRFIVGRSGEVRDVLIDFCGGLAGVILVLLISSIRRKRHR